MNQFKTLLKNLGPGLLFASMAIGTSHLVLSTKAGATYGWAMIIPILLANLLKYPFFEFGIRYTNVTGRSLIEGYSRRGKAYMWVYALITLVTTFTILAALYVVTAGLLANLFGITAFTVSQIALGLFAFLSVVLIVGRYKFSCVIALPREQAGITSAPGRDAPFSHITKGGRRPRRLRAQYGAGVFARGAPRPTARFCVRR